MGKRGLTVREMILVHLLPFSRNAEDFECPQEMCQEGISRAIGKSRAHVTLELGRMKEVALLHERMAHVSGARSKRKTYSLTAQGIERGRQITEHVRGLSIDVRGQSRAGTMDGCQAAEALVGQLGMPRAMALNAVVACNGVIDLDAQSAEGAPAAPARPAFADYSPDIIEVAARDPGRSIDAHVLRANMLAKRGNASGALDVIEKALGIFGSDEENHKLHYSRAAILRKLGNNPAALAEVNRALGIARESRDRLSEARCMMEKAMILHGMGKTAQSLEFLGAAADIFRSEDSQVDVLRCELNLGIIHRGMGELGKAGEHLEAALRLAEKTGMERLNAFAMVNIADLLNELGDSDRAEEMAAKAADIFRVLDEPLMLAAALFNLGVAQVRLGRTDEGLLNLDRAVGVLERSGMLASRTDWLEKYAAILEGLGKAEKAKSVLGKI